MDWLHPRLLLIFPLIYLAGGAILYALQDRLIYLPGSEAFGVCPALPNAERIDRDGVRAYLVPHESGRIAVVYHGNAGAACNRAHYADTFSKAGYATLIVEYPGYGGDAERPTTKRILSSVESVSALLPSLGYTETVVLGESIGSGPASYHASITPVQSLLLVTPYDRLSAVVQDTLPWYPARLLLRGDLRVDLWAASALRTLIIDAERDEVIELPRTDALVTALAERATRVTIPGATHNSISIDPLFSSTIQDFLRSAQKDI